MSNEIVSFKLTKEMDRLDLSNNLFIILNISYIMAFPIEQQVDQLRSDMKHAIDQAAKDQEITLNQMKHQAAVETEDALAIHQLSLKKGDTDLEIKLLRDLKSIGVDINAYLKGQQETPVAEEIRIHPVTVL